ncbi:MAG: phenylalanine--tRNA ligase subunit alpha, partial [Deltaproteobacteria bacterium]|nr:phenylalanine--tRNA ligase subunit alpha [Deltaproteobacteria bacterium]
MSLTKLNELENSFLKDLDQVQSTKELEDLKVNYLGKKGRVNDFMRVLKDLPPDQKADFGQKINQVKNSLLQKLESYRLSLNEAEFDQQMASEWIDITIDPLKTKIGSLNPITIIQDRLEDVFMAMGFQILDGPHVETEYYNFEALNFPPHHPARDMQDTFYFDTGHLLRTQTSTIQIRAMEYLKPPLRIIATGKVFRCERTDASHESCFHQIEGMMVDKGISVANLIYFMRTMLSEVFEKEVEIRLRPGYFPFVEPGFELEISCLLCEGKGCNVCKRTGWMELLGCGMVHPNVLKAGNIDPQLYSGFAFGMGIDRLAMMKYAINDIRFLHSGN